MLLLLGLVRDPPTRRAVAPRHAAQLRTAVATRHAVAPRHAAQLRMAVDSAEPCQDEDAIKADAETAFALLDLDGNGSVERAEFEKYLLTYGYTPSAVAKIFSTLDLDGNNEISLQELRDGLVEYCRCGACEPKVIEQSHAEADALFAAADTNDDGELSSDELRVHLLERGRYTAEAVDCIFRSIDANVCRVARSLSTLRPAGWACYSRACARLRAQSDGGLSRDELRSGFLQYERLRLAMVAVVTTLVRKKEWSPIQKR